MSSIRPTNQMHWYLWEAILMEYAILKQDGCLSSELISEVDSISAEVKKSSKFSEDLMERACKVEFELSKHNVRLKEIINDMEHDRSKHIANLTGVY